MRGVVKCWLGQYGFLSNDDGGSDFFVHMKDCAIHAPLQVGSYFEFDVVDSQRKVGKKHAVNLRRLDAKAEEVELAYAAREQPIKFGEGEMGAPHWTIKLSKRPKEMPGDGQ